MFISLSIPWVFIDATPPMPRPHIVAPGEYEIERIPNPLGYTDHPWLVLKGTMIGGTENFWQQWLDPHSGNFRIDVHPNEKIPNTC
jgi:hypothetical protein